MVRKLLIYGLVAGACGGVLATGFAELAGEPAIDAAISFEETEAAAAGESPEPELVARGLQRSVGLLAAAVIYGLALGGLFALVFGAVYGRIARASPARTALWLAAAAFVVVFLVPFVKYPANPPAVGSEDTIGNRTLLYVVMIEISVLAAVAAVRLRRALAGRASGATATLVACAAYLAIVVAAGVALPGIHEVPREFPATALWTFREASVGMQAVLWSTVGLVFAHAAQRVMTGEPLWPWRSSRQRVAAGAGD